MDERLIDWCKKESAVTAHHEAAHAVAERLFGDPGSIECISMRPSDTSAGFVKRVSINTRLLALHAREHATDTLSFSSELSNEETIAQGAARGCIRIRSDDADRFLMRTAAT
jgi:hypothetical protein